MYNQQPGYGMYPPMQQQPLYGAGVVFNTPQVAATNPLGDAKIKHLLETGGGAPKLQITEDALNQAICTHRYNNQSMLMEVAGGKQHCKICGAEFNLLEEVDEEAIAVATSNLHDIMHTAKVMWMDCPDQIAKENFQVLAVVDQVPMIFAIAADRFNKLSTNPLSATNPTNNAFASFNNIMNPGYQYGAPGYQVPQQGFAPQGQPVYGQQPAYQMQPQGYPVQQPYDQYQGMTQMTPMQQQVVAQAPGVSNGFGYSQPAPAPVANVQQPVQAPEGAVQVTQTLQV